MREQSASSNRRLDSWKEIAAFFGRDERTVRRWEKESSLPVHRLPGAAKGRVFAYEEELRAWLDNPRSLEAQDKQAGTEVPRPLEVAARPQDWYRAFPARTMATWAATLVLCAVLGGAAVRYRKGHGFAVHAGEMSTKAQKLSADRAEAEDFYLKGRYYWNKRTPDDLNRAVDYFTQAIVRDPEYAKAYVGLADCYNLLREFSVMPPNEAFSRALAAAQKAVELDPNSADAHTSFAFASFWGDLRVAQAEREFKRAIELDPNNTRAHHWYATYLAELRRFPEAMVEIERARELDPSSTPILADKGFILGSAGHFREAEALLLQIEKSDPSFFSAHSYLGGFHFDLGDYPGYFEEEGIAARLRHDEKLQARLALLQKAYATGGAQGLLAAKLDADQKLYGQGQASDYTLADDYAQLNDKSDAMHYLEAAHDNHDWPLCTLLLDNSFRKMRQDPEFRNLLAQVGLPAGN
jgi:tetratricopeptide (TPR) repeat protein